VAGRYRRRMSALTFGTFIPQGWKSEYRDIPDAAQQWQITVDMAVLAEELGFDSVWVYDHFHNVPKPIHSTVFECWTVMAAISQRTSRVRLGQMVSCNAYRLPSVVAKITSTIDVISGGRLDLGIGAGWYQNEYKGYGLGFGTPKERIGMLREGVEIIRSMWTQPDTTYNGTYYQLDGAQCDPKPLQQPSPPIWIGGGGEQLTLRVVARLGDWANFGGGATPDVFQHKSALLAEHCKAVGRDFDDISRSVAGDICIRETEAELRAVHANALILTPFDEWAASHFVGSADQVAARMQQYIDLGCKGFVPWCTDFPDTETLHAYATIMQHFR
jgi:F420-dependent oxidoreductase-like protein